ncbi:hypothetical protein BJ508DRAFT_313249 [Ascobolus immersus RN42]|uniref:Uncharacterized protein n=1 Tax=Ascobolus immersus RN42 TaxID=1160509 RepID=A0A3N4HPT1_ASCIM|nr:hypothetical protein BJ508DRAFT_313249 [Ascobolus immersus RN42]
MDDDSSVEAFKYYCQIPATLNFIRQTTIRTNLRNPNFDAKLKRCIDALQSRRIFANLNHLPRNITGAPIQTGVNELHLQMSRISTAVLESDIFLLVLDPTMGNAHPNQEKRNCGENSNARPFPIPKPITARQESFTHNTSNSTTTATRVKTFLIGQTPARKSQYFKIASTGDAKEKSGIVQVQETYTKKKEAKYECDRAHIHALQYPKSRKRNSYTTTSLTRELEINCVDIQRKARDFHIDSCIHVLASESLQSMSTKYQIHTTKK